MKIFYTVIAAAMLFPLTINAQKKSDKKTSLKNNTLQDAKGFTIMPYNRLIQSAGKVVTYGDSSLENHALDVCILPDKKNIAIEDRYGIAVVNSISNKIISRWSFTHDKDWSNLISTYSGITSFTWKNKMFIAWGASGFNHKAAIIIACWDGKKITNISGIYIDRTLPADAAIPNQVIANTENGTLYLYAVLNGNDQLVKINFDTKNIVYAVRTGVAPYGVCIIKNKAYVTNWAGPVVTDTTREHAGTPWGSAYVSTVTGATTQGSLSIINIQDGTLQNELLLGLHPNAIIKSNDEKFIYVANANSDYVSVIDVVKEKVIDSIPTGIFGNKNYYGSSPNALMLDNTSHTLYVANGMDNALAVIQLTAATAAAKRSIKVKGYIPTEAYPSGMVIINKRLYVTNLEAKGSRVSTAVNNIKNAAASKLYAYTIHKELASFSVINVPAKNELSNYTTKVKELNFLQRLNANNQPPGKNVPPKPIPERIGEPSLFKHVVYIIKENKTYDQVFGDIAGARGDKDLCTYGANVTPNQHRLAQDFVLLDNYYVSGKSSAEGHQWTDAAMVSDYIERSVRAWFRSYPHRQEDALVYNKNGFIWNDAMDHGKKVRIYGEACLTHYEGKMQWADIYNKYVNHEPIAVHNTTTIAQIRPVISATYPDCDNFNFTDQLRADEFINEWNKYEAQQGDQLPDLLILSLPDDHTAGISQNFPTPEAMIADNDLALGRIVETIAHSRFWSSTVVFVTEDDSQSGWDHISSYRTICQVISPYSKLNKIIHTDYNQTSMVRTIEQILGIPPMNVIDATAQPMFDCFGQSEQSSLYKVIPNNIPLNSMNKPLAQLSGKAKYYARLSAEKAFKELDSGNDDLMNTILWFAAKGNQKYPGIK